MKKQTKIIIGISIAAIIIIVVFSFNSEFFKGALKPLRLPARQSCQVLKALCARGDQKACSAYINNRCARFYIDALRPGRVVSAETSPVTSVVVSRVTSPAATSRLASAVTSPVTSGIPVPAFETASVDTNQLPVLTPIMLKSIARDDYVANPAKFRLSNQAKLDVLRLYKLKSGIK